MNAPKFKFLFFAGYWNQTLFISTNSTSDRQSQSRNFEGLVPVIDTWLITVAYLIRQQHI